MTPRVGYSVIYLALEVNLCDYYELIWAAYKQFRPTSSNKIAKITRSQS